MDSIYMERLTEVDSVQDGSSYAGCESTRYITGLTFPTFTSLGSVLVASSETPCNTEHPPPHVEAELVFIREEHEKGRGITAKEYVCELCPATFNNSSNLKSHQRTHTGERPYVCEICKAAFVQSSNLKSHKRIHTGERPFACKECGQSFSRSSHLTGHKRTHTGEKPYMCGICNASFATSTHLRNHMRKHTGEKPYSCHLCDQSFNQNTSLQTHLLVHSGERPYKCVECPGAFRSKRDLISHARLHSQAKPFICVNCDKNFKTNQYLQKHIKKCCAQTSTKKRGRPRSGIKNATHSSEVREYSSVPRRERIQKSKPKEIYEFYCEVNHDELPAQTNDSPQFQSEINEDTVQAISEHQVLNPHHNVLAADAIQTAYGITQEQIDDGTVFHSTVQNENLVYINHVPDRNNVEHVVQLPM